MKIWMKQKENGNMKKVLAVCTAALILASCQESFEGRTDQDNYYASVETFGTGTRTTLEEDRSVVWSSGDRIAIFEGSDKGNAYQVLNASVGSSSGEFSLMENLSTEGSGAAIEGIVAVYPFSEDLSIEPDGDKGFIIKGVSFPAEQTYTSGSFADGAFPMAAICEQGHKNLSFKNIGGVLRLSLKGDYAVSSITVRGNSGEPVSGPATVTIGPDGIPSVTMAEDASRSVTLVCDPAVQLDADNAKEFHISIPVTEFETGFTVTVTDSEGNTYRKQTTLANPVMRSAIHIMPPTDLSEEISDEATENYIDLGIGRNAQITSYDAASGNLSLEYSSSTIPFIEPGKAFVMPVEQGGDIRVIDSYTTSGSTVTLQTSEGNMCNLFKNTSFTLSTSSEPDTRSAGEWNVINPSAYGYIDGNGIYHEVFNAVDMTKSAKYITYTDDKTLWSFNQDYSGTELISGTAGSLSWERFTFDGNLNGIFRFDFGEKRIDQIRSEGEVRLFRYELNGSFDIDMLLKYEYSASFTEEDDKIIKKHIIPSILFTFYVGTVPVLLQVDTDLGKAYNFTAKGSISASAGLNISKDISIGAQWTPENGVEMIREVVSDEKLYEPTFEIEASAEAKVSYYPHIGIKLYKFFGPWVEPRPYLAESIKAGARASTDGDNYIGWKAETSYGLDVKMGIGLDFIIVDKDIWEDSIEWINKPIFTAPARISLVSPDQSTVIGKGEAVEAVFKAESYSPITGKYYPCPAALVSFKTDDGTSMPEMAFTNINGEVSVQWNPDTDAAAEFNLTASILDNEGETVDEQTLTVCTEEDDRWVDLGLSVLWAAYNVGASSPEGYGGYYVWEKDIADIIWGDGGRMPTYDEAVELMSCKFEYGLYNDVAGHYVTGPSGNSIFLPFTIDNEAGSFWTSTLFQTEWAYRLYHQMNKTDVHPWIRNASELNTVRPVKNKDVVEAPENDDIILEGDIPLDSLITRGY